MKRRRGGGDWRHGESFGTSLADVLTTALGCVLLLFLVAVLSVRHALTREKSAHGETRQQLVVQQHELTAVELENRRSKEEQSALQSALSVEKETRAGLERALQAAEAEKQGLKQDLIADSKALVDLQTRHDQFRNAVRTAVEQLAPQTARPVDLVVVIDGTGSMKPSLDAARQHLHGLISALRVVSPTTRIGIVVYRDRRESEDLRLQVHPLSDDVVSLKHFLDGIVATSTRVDTDLPEWMLGGVHAAVRSEWRPEATRVITVVSDAGVQDGAIGEAVAEAGVFAAGGGRLFVLSTLPSGYEEGNSVAQNYQDEVLVEHEALAKAGGGVHLTGMDADRLLHEIMEATLRARTEDPLRDLEHLLEPSD